MSKCKAGYYYCYTDKKCKPISKGLKMTARFSGGGKEPEEVGIDKPLNGNGNHSNGNGNGSGSSNGGSNGGVSEGSLHKWFKGSKSKDGKGGWVNVVTGGTCASDEPGEGTPKCVSSAKRASMSKSERLSAARRKKRADPGQQQKSGAAKPTYVSTDKPKKKMKEDYLDERLGGKGVSKKAASGSIYPGKKGDGDFPDSDRGAGNKAKRKAGLPVEKKSPTYKAYVMNKEEKETPKNVKKIAKELDKAVELHASQAKRLRAAGISEAKDKKGKGSGTKDACYHKVKSRYSVWPSAYASGALVKCRKVGAANWGNKSEEVVSQEGYRVLAKGDDGKRAQFSYKDEKDAKKFASTFKKATVTKEEVVNELDTTTLHSYVTKASSDAVKTGVDAGIAGMAGKDKKRDKSLDKAYKRARGINRAAGKLAIRAIRKEETLPEAKVDKGRSDYGKASIRNYRRMGPGHDDPGMFDPEGKRGKAIEKRREEHKARRGVKGAKVPAYKVDEGSSYGLYKGSGKPGGVMKDYLDKKAKKLEKQRASQPDRYKNNPAFDSTSPNSRSTDLARTRKEGVSFQQFQEKCWPGYEKKGMKTMFGKRYPNCVKKKK